MKAILILILCLLAPITALCVGTWTQAGFWMIILTPIIIGFFVGLGVPSIGNGYGHYVGAFIANNNTRSNTLVAVAILAVVSAFIGGFGAPLLEGSPEVAQIRAKVAEKADNAGAKNALLEVLGNGQVRLAKTQPQAHPAEDDEKPPVQYASWYNWLVAIFLLPCAFLYWPFARRDEVIGAWQEVSRRRDQRRREVAADKASADAAATATPATATAPAKSTAGWWWNNWTFGKDFASDLGAEFVIEFFKQLARLRGMRV